jgi:hypothetical protein
MRGPEAGLAVSSPIWPSSRGDLADDPPECLVPFVGPSIRCPGAEPSLDLRTWDTGAARRSVIAARLAAEMRWRLAGGTWATSYFEGSRAGTRRPNCLDPIGRRHGANKRLGARPIG